MRKIPTLFVRDPRDMRYVTREVHPDCKWVLDGEGTATRKYDGTCVMLDLAGEWWARREVKPGKHAPAGFVQVEHDRLTGKTVGWEPIGQSAFVKYHAQAVDSHVERRTGYPAFLAGTYELCGPKINGNPEDYTRHLLVRHADAEPLDLTEDGPGPYSVDEIVSMVRWVGERGWEGIVWHHPDGRMAKLKRRDFPQEPGRPEPSDV